MPRKGQIQKRKIEPDPKYHDVLVSKFINCIMARGKRSLAENILYDALDQMGQKTGEDPLRLFKKAVEEVKPVLEVRSRRVGGSTYQVPVEVRPERRTALAIRWVINNAKARKTERRMHEKLAGELLDAVNHRGGAYKKKEDTHKMADANKAFAHYRW
ncbi:MAG: 30S ribosomal protein S7 [Deltaproteobacteria bacterium]|nr:30S ribosomal protein S7 [Deltaproteobacteria bacterium]